MLAVINRIIPQQAVRVAIGHDFDNVVKPLPWVSYAGSLVLTVLTDHRFTLCNHSSIGSEHHCHCGLRPRTEVEWRQHVSIIIAREVGYSPAVAIEALSHYQPDKVNL